MTSAPQTSNRPGPIIWTAAILTSALVVAILFSAVPGINVTIWVAVPFLAPVRVVGATAYEAADATSSSSSPRARSIIKGTLLSAPLAVVLIALLGSADPVIRWGTDHIAAWLPDWSFPQRMMFFAFLLLLTLGANSIASRQISAKFPQFAPLGVSATVGLTEQRMMLWSAAVVLWLFVALQASYFIHPP